MLPLLVRTLRITNWLNWSAAAILAFLLAVMVISPGTPREVVAQVIASEKASDVAITWFKWACAMSLPVCIATHLILTRVIAMIRDTQTGAGFSEANADRLSVIAWALLAINVVDLIFGQLSVWASTASGLYFGWSLSLTGWFAVPLLFVLARLLREGAQMRDDLEGTV